MNIWTIICLILAVTFGIITLIYSLLKERAAILISGFNSLPKEEIEKYDKLRMSKDMRNSLLLWFIVLFLGAILSYFFSNYFAIASIIIWIILFFKEVHFDPDKAFEKYKNK